MAASEASAHNFFRRLICPRTTGARTCFSPITGAATSSPPCSTSSPWRGSPVSTPGDGPPEALTRASARRLSQITPAGTARERRGRFDAISRRLTPPLHAGGMTESEFPPTRSKRILCAELAKNGPFVLVGEPIAAVNWCKGDAAQQRKLKNPSVSTAMKFLVGTRGFDFAGLQRFRQAAIMRRFGWGRSSVGRATAF